MAIAAAVCAVRSRSPIAVPISQINGILCPHDGGGGAEHIEIDAAALATFQIQIHARCGRAADGAAGGEQRILGRDLLAHDEDLFPLTRRSFRARIGEFVRALQELFLVAPDKEHLEQFQFQVTARRIACDGDANQIRGLVVQTVGHVEEVGLCQRITPGPD